MLSFLTGRGMPAKEARSRKRVEHLIHEAERSNAATAEIEELDQEACRTNGELRPSTCVDG